MASRPRPQSTIAQIFADDLDAMFGLTPEVEKLNKDVEDKKLKVSSGNRELQDLEARLKKAEQRLARVSRHNSPATSPTSEQPPILENNNVQQQQQSATSPKHPLAQQPSFPASRPATSQQQQQAYGNNGNGSNNASEYVMVDRTAAQQAQRA